MILVNMRLNVFTTQLYKLCVQITLKKIKKKSGFKSRTNTKQKESKTATEIFWILFPTQEKGKDTARLMVRMMPQLEAMHLAIRALVSLELETEGSRNLVSRRKINLFKY